MIEIVLQQRDNFGNPTGREKCFKAEKGVDIYDFWIKNTPQIKKKRKKKDSKHSKK